ncbi:MAG: ferrochelatase [Coriobacteriia bacterium]|nr:ferrochelatase [Coriobacteriia bacterium]
MPVMLMWSALIASSLLAGAGAVALLASRRRVEPLAVLVSLATATASIYLVVAAWERYQRWDVLGYAIAIVATGLAGGWALAVVTLERLAKTPECPPATRNAEPQGHTAVIIMACSEPTEYSPSETALLLQAIADSEMMEPSLLTLPLLFFAQKSRYQAIGGTSPAESQLRLIAERLSRELAPETYGPVLWAACSGSARLAVRVSELIACGYHKIVVVGAAAGENLAFAEAKREVDTMRIDPGSAQLSYARNLTDSVALTNMLARRIHAVPETEGVTGVVLIGYGQSENHSRMNPGFDESETSFLNRLRARLIDGGIDSQHIRIAWTDWVSPDITSAVRHLAALGCQRMLIVPAVHCVDTLGTLLDLDIAIKQARIENTVSMVLLPTWHDDETLIEELKLRILELGQVD